MHVEYIPEDAFTLAVPYVYEATECESKLISQMPGSIVLFCFWDVSEGQDVFQIPSNCSTRR